MPSVFIAEDLNLYKMRWQILKEPKDIGRQEIFFNTFAIHISRIHCLRSLKQPNSACKLNGLPPQGFTQSVAPCLARSLAR